MKLILKIEALFFLVFMFFLSHNAYAVSYDPGIKDVLEGQAFMYNWMFISLGGLIVLGIAVFAVKAHFISLKKKKLKNEEIQEKEASKEVPQLKELEAKLFFTAAELKQKEAENEIFKKELMKMHDIIEERRKNEEMLRKSAIELRREQERVVMEKERLAIELNKKNSPRLFSDIDIEEIIVVEGETSRNLRLKEDMSAQEMSIKRVIEKDEVLNKNKKIKKSKTTGKKVVIKKRG
ncbi:hypothetical protein A2230_03825 [candidate division WOR-1 bacterium RIFOXYA2_FULL_36_21]|uniref:Uncharacterized protein n=1 Tax=candidate division WOR-1 bacterium RIFOXYB2_FULL_36_35 TaxID=1802578 RepID=A0A1F4S3Y2_UNCSA|nr:MAG: hypothetical protein A2230_03825 [candidate division WOR-1 bacterium RIFOXYA2_FULL_36_21]OGC14453.1 MAG: hypothetical protein A2290_08520 [candidate division WOR-1 bacterium RIFOXYB2_FULL_36_35]OGC18535.1 MAG: hypothetical protein A2282_03150 [candidate division WOR-1 bacterium RIFOXYA12_FULL_36_13]